jgi:predicted dehydrogenase
MTLGVGVVGCGNISGIYLENIAKFERIRLAALADLDQDRARSAGSPYGNARILGTDELLADPEVDIVLNLTTPDAHADVALAAVRAGKHVYNEKPLTVSLDDGRQLLGEASRKGVRVGCAPDTPLGAGIATCRRLIDDGAVGEIVGGTAFFTCPGHEAWHPDPDFYYKAGAGPLFDMGPYYITALAALLGPVRRVAGLVRRSFATRTIESEPRRGATIAVEVPTHEAALLEFAGGPVVALLMSFDVRAARLPVMEIYGSRGTLAVPDPNMYGGPVELCDMETGEWREQPLAGEFAENSRGLGVAEMAAAIEEGRPHAASGELALHALEVMHAVRTASAGSRHVKMKTAAPRPEPLPAGWRP